MRWSNLRWGPASALIHSGGAPDKVARPHYRRADPARDRLRHAADSLFFAELWRRADARADADFSRLRLAFLEQLAGIARREFYAALDAIPCASIVRPRAEVRGRARLDGRLHEAMKPFKQVETADA